LFQAAPKLSPFLDVDKLRIFHLTDLHFSDDSNRSDFWRQFSQAFLKAFSEINSQDLLIISGDITLKGQSTGYSIAETIIKEIWINNKGDRRNIFACPGNHDIVNHGFSEFDNFIYGLRRDSLITFSRGNKTSNLLSSQGVDLLLVNSCHTLEHRYGYVDIDMLSRELSSFSQLQENKEKIAVIHHNLIGVHKDDTSTLRSAMPLIQLLDKYKFSKLLHGHQHAKLQINAGNVEIFGGRSLQSLDPNYSNGISVYEISNNIWNQTNYRFVKDGIIAGQAAFEIP